MTRVPFLAPCLEASRPGSFCARPRRGRRTLGSIRHTRSGSIAVLHRRAVRGSLRAGVKQVRAASAVGYSDTAASKKSGVYAGGG